MQSDRIPRIIEGVDPFNDQAASKQFAVGDEAVEVSREKKRQIREIYSLLREKVPDISAADARELFIFQFGVALDDMPGFALLDAKDWVGRLEVRPVVAEEEREGSD